MSILNIKKGNERVTQHANWLSEKKMAELIREGVYNPLSIPTYSASELQTICSLVDIPISKSATKVMILSIYLVMTTYSALLFLHNLLVFFVVVILQPVMVKHIESLHIFLIEGKSECHVFEAVPSCSGGKVFKNCHHQVS